ncbi:MAG TPA: hypothetical protein VK024_08410, partial [Actinomycetaceae bacterium]|nr:hypothetical protein [Actinomycetaceae bacterium]
PDFRLLPDIPRRGVAPSAGGFDALTAARRISSAGSARVVPSVSADASPSAVIAEIARFSRQHGGPARLQIDVGESLADVRRLAAAVRHARGELAPQIVIPVATAAHVALAGEIADIVRIREHDVAWARELRYAVRAAALAAGRSPLPVLVDVRAVIGEDPVTARVRAELVDSLGGAPAAGALTIVDTPEEATATLAHWLEAGAADGFTIEPASLATDLGAVIHEVIPALGARGFEVSARRRATPALRRTSGPAVRELAHAAG